MVVTALLFALVLAPVLVCGVYGFYIAYRLYHPYRKNRRSLNLKELEATQVRIPSGSGIELRGLLLRSDKSRHIVLITHELGSFKESKIKIARRLVRAGFNVLLFDLRNHGESSRDPSLGPMSEKFTDDVAAALRFARGVVPAMETISLFAFSFSTFPSLYIVTRETEQPDAIVLDSGPSVSIGDLYGKYLDTMGRYFVSPAFRVPVLYPLLKFWFQLFGTRMLATRWPPDLSAMRSRVLFMVNEEDPIFLKSQILAVAELVPDKRIWICPGSSHLQAHRSDPEGYEQALLGFLKEQATTSA